MQNTGTHAWDIHGICLEYSYLLQVGYVQNIHVCYRWDTFRIFMFVTGGICSEYSCLLQLGYVQNGHF